MEKPLRIIKFEAKNVKRIRAISIQPDEKQDVVLLTGRNRQGKSSVIESIFYALGGKSAIPSKPIRQGEKEASVTLDLGDYLVERRFTEAGSYLDIKTKAGFKAPSPQTFLASRLGGYAANPLEFLRLKTDEQVKALQSLIDIKFDPTEFERISGLSLKGVNVDDPIAVLDSGHRHLYEKRTETNKEVTRLEGAAKTEKALIPAGKENVEKVSATALMQERLALEAVKTANDAKRADLKALEDKLSSQAHVVYDDQIKANQAERDKLPEMEKLLQDRLSTLQATELEILDLQTKLEATQDHRKVLVKAVAENDVEIDHQKIEIQKIEEPNLEAIYEKIQSSSSEHKEQWAEVFALEDPDFTDIDARIAATDETNEIAGHVEQYRKHLEELETARNDSSKLTDRLDAIKQHKGKLIVEAGLPVEALGFEDGEVSYKGLPLSQASGADQIEISCAIAMAGHPEIGILTIDVGWSELDSESKAVMVGWAKRTGTQIWSVKVSDGPGEEGFYIEDGTVMAIDGEPVGLQMLAAKPEELAADNIPF